MVFHILGDRTLMQNLHADGLYHEPASKCNFDLNRQNTLLLNLFGTIGRKNTTLDGMYHILLVTVCILIEKNWIRCGTPPYERPAKKLLFLSYLQTGGWHTNINPALKQHSGTLRYYYG